MADKGLKSDSVGLFGGTLLGISSVAPAYVLTATVGILAVAVGEKTPVVIIAGFLPMFFAAYAYREFNKIMPDSGTSFTWTSKAFGPYIGWIGGWTAVIATIIVLSNLAGVAVQFLYQFIGAIVHSDTISDLWLNKPVNVITCLAFLAIATYVAYRGIDATEKIQIVLVSFQMIVLLVFAVMAIAKHETAGTGTDFSWSWFSPAGLTLSAFIVGLSGSIFGFWGWDTALTVNEESKDSDTTPGKAALLCVLSILATYLIVTIAMQMFAGMGDRRSRAEERGGLGQRVRQPRRAGDGLSAEPGPLSRRAGLVGGEPDHDVPADLSHVAGDGCLRGDAQAVRPYPPEVQVAEHGHLRGGHRRGRVLHGDDHPQREGADRHHPVARHHDLLLLRTGRLRLHLVLPAHAVRERRSTSCSSSCSRCSAVSGCSSC